MNDAFWLLRLIAKMAASSTKRQLKRWAKLDDGYIEAVRDFAEDAILIWDTHVRGLRVRIGKSKVSWTYFQQLRFRGKRSTICKNLGSWPLLNVASARREALQIAGAAAAGRPEKGKREAIKFDAAIVVYLDYLKKKAITAGKEPTWNRIAASVVRKHL